MFFKVINLYICRGIFVFFKSMVHQRNYAKIINIILNLLKKHKVNIDKSFCILFNIGPGRFSSLRTSVAVAIGIKISKKINLFGFKNEDLGQFNPANIDFLIKKNLLQKKLIKPLYLS